jgi:hypothetical protein
MRDKRIPAQLLSAHSDVGFTMQAYNNIFGQLTRQRLDFMEKWQAAAITMARASPPPLPYRAICEACTGHHLQRHYCIVFGCGISSGGAFPTKFALNRFSLCNKQDMGD